MNKAGLVKAVAFHFLAGWGMAFLIACGIPAVASAQTQRIRIVTYNIQDDVTQGGIGFTNPLAGLIAPFTGTGTFTQNSSGTVTNGGVLEGIGEEILAGGVFQPIDILALQETTNNASSVQPIVDGLNAFYSFRGISAGYAQSPIQLTSSGGDGGGPNALVYNTNTIHLIASFPLGVPSGNGIPRQIGRYLFAPAGVVTNASNVFYMYVSHYKSGTDTNTLARRTIEAGIIRSNSAALPANSRVLYVGDYNVSTSTETSYQNIVSTTLIGIQGFDPFNPSGAKGIDWTVNSLSNFVKTESCRSLHFRDDFQVMSSNVYFGVAGGLAYIPGTYHTFGNNGSSPYFGAITSGNTSLNTNLQANPPISAAQCYTNLYGASDHLPVIADYTIPLPPPAPVASFTGNPTNGVAPLAVTFTDTSSGSITNWSWDFGDGGLTNLATNTVLYTYNTAGVYAVTEIVSGPGGSSTNTKAGYITVLTPPPVASFSGSPTSGAEPLLVTFTDASTGSITNWSWDFGNGSTTNFAVSTNPTSTYTAGTYTVTLTVSGPDGSGTNSLTSYITAFTPFQAWQVAYFGSTTNPAAAASADPDGDGQNNLAEFLAGTNPTNSASGLRITSVAAQGGDVLVSWTTAGGETNMVQGVAGSVNGSYSTNFLDLSPLIIIPGSGDATTNYLDSGGATNVPARYYRIRLVP